MGIDRITLAQPIALIEALHRGRSAGEERATAGKPKRAAGAGSYGGVEHLCKELSLLLNGSSSQTEIDGVRPAMLRLMLKWELGEAIERHPEFPHLLARLEADFNASGRNDIWAELVEYLRNWQAHR